MLFKELSKWSSYWAYLLCCYLDSTGEQQQIPAKVMKKQPSKADKQEYKEHHLEVGDSDGSSKEDGEDPLSDISDVFDTVTPPPTADDVAKQPKKVLKKEDSRTAADALIDQQFAGLTDHTMDLADWPLFAVSTCLLCTYLMCLLAITASIHLYTVTMTCTSVHCHHILYICTLSPHFVLLYTVTTTCTSVCCHHILYTITTFCTSVHCHHILYICMLSPHFVHCHHILYICTLSPHLLHCSLLRRNHQEEDQENVMERRKNCLNHLRTKKPVTIPILLHHLPMKMTSSQLSNKWRREKSVITTT